jgi:hypothetical protein
MLHKFFIDNNGTQTEIFPSNSPIKISGERKDYQNREKVSSDVIVSGDKGYNYLKTLEVSNPSLILIMKRQINGLWVERIRSAFYPRDCDWDTDKCSVSIKCVELDAYSNLLLNWETQRNVLSVYPLQQKVNIEVVQPQFKYFTETINHVFAAGTLRQGLNNDGSLSDYIYHPIWPDNSTILYLIQQVYESNPNLNHNVWQIKDIFIQLSSTPPFGSNHFNNTSVNSTITVTWFSCYTLTFDLDGAVNPPDTINGFSYIDVNIVSNINGHVFRQWQIKPYEAYQGSLTPFISYNCYYNGLTLYYNTLNGYANIIGTANTTYQTTQYIWRDLGFVLQDFIDLCMGGTYVNGQMVGGGVLNLKSQLMYSEVPGVDINPVTGTKNLIRTFDPTNDIKRAVFIAAKSDLILSGNQFPTERATMQLFSLKRLLEGICFMFNAGWCVSGNNLLFEHITCLDNNNIYPSNNNTTTIKDISQEVGVKLHNQYNYDNSGYYHTNRLTMIETFGIDAIGVDMVMDASFNSPKQVLKIDTIDSITSDLANILNNPNNINKDGLCIAVIEGKLNAQPTDVFEVVNYEGAITGQQLTNGILSVSQLEETYHKSGKPFPTGIINLKSIAFADILKNKIQMPVTISNCEIFDANKLYQTEIGNGIPQSWEEDTTSNQIELKLKY